MRIGQFSVLLSGLALGLNFDHGRAQVEAISDAPTRCQALANADFSGVQDAPTRVTRATPVEATRTTPAYCLVEGHVTPQIEFEVRLPSSNWNGKFLALENVQTGNRCDTYLKRGYACMPMFRGRKKGRGDAEWVALLLHDLKAWADGNRSTHLLTLAGKAIVERYYLKAAGRSYLMGCSAGGYSAMLEAQIFPWDFDGIVAGAPSMNSAEWLMHAAWTGRSFLGQSDQPILTIDDIQLLHRAVLATCDRDDGVEDGIIGNPVGCQFDPATLLCKVGQNTGCLAPFQVAAVKRIYDGPMTSTGERTSTPSVFPGSELGWNAWFGSILKFPQPYFNVSFYGASPEWELTEFDFDRDYKRLGLGALFTTPTNPDLRRFKAAGGKLLAYLGGNDETLVTRIVDFYETTERTMGGRAATQEFFRLFVVPGMGHCSGGVGAYAIDYLRYLEAWVEQGQPPDSMIGAHVSDAYLAALPVKWPAGEKPPGAVTPAMRVALAVSSLALPLDSTVPVSFTRPVYPYPLYAKYKGSGDPNDAVNFGPVNPRPISRASRE